MDDVDKLAMPFGTLEERMALREACRQMRDRTGIEDMDLAAEFATSAAVTIEKLIVALEHAEAAHGGAFGAELRDLFRKRFLTRVDGKELLRHDVYVWTFNLGVAPTGVAVVDIRLQLNPVIQSGAR